MMKKGALSQIVAYISLAIIFILLVIILYDLNTMVPQYERVYSCLGLRLPMPTLLCLSLSYVTKGLLLFIFLLLFICFVVLSIVAKRKSIPAVVNIFVAFILLLYVVGSHAAVKILPFYEHKFMRYYDIPAQPKTKRKAIMNAIAGLVKNDTLSCKDITGALERFK